MADEAFALSPISARAAQPNEEDYAAIHEAFMETSRGRWFLGEYAKRNRNADTRLVLDAVARIEGSLAAQKEAAAAADLTEALAAIRGAVVEARDMADAGLDGLAFDERLAPIHRGVRIIREISWRWRETGADSRICDILDSQVAAIEAGTGQVSVDEARAAIDQAFATITTRIDEYSRSDAAPAEAPREPETANVVPFPAPVEETAAPEAVVAAALIESPVAEAVAAPAVASPAEVAPSPAEVADLEIVDEALAEAQDEAVLDLIAAEMSAPQPMDDEPAVGQAALAAPQPAEPTPEAMEAIAPDAEMIAAPVAPPEPAAAAPPVPEPAPATTQFGEAEVSIGSAVIANGILRKPNPPANDPLAPIRRMSQAEKIAFFS